MTDAEELALVSTAVAVIESGKGEEAIHNMLNALKPGNNFKEIKNAYKRILADSWGKVYIIRTTDSVWYFDNRSSKRGDVKIFKQGTPQAEKLKEEFADDVAKHEAEAIKLMNEGGSKPVPAVGGYISDIVSKISEALSDAGNQITERNKNKFNSNRDALVKNLEAIKNPNNLPAQVEKAFNDAGLGFYWANSDAFEEVTKVSRSDIYAAINASIKKPTGSATAGTTGNTVGGTNVKGGEKALSEYMLDDFINEARDKMPHIDWNFIKGKLLGIRTVTNASAIKQVRDILSTYTNADFSYSASHDLFGYDWAEEVGKKMASISLNESHKESSSAGTGTGAQEGKVLTGKTLKDFKPSEAPRVVQLLSNKKTEMALDDYVDTIYKDLQMLEAMGVSVLGDDVIEKITEITKMKDDMEREDAWQEFVEQKKCKK